MSSTTHQHAAALADLVRLRDIDDSATRRRILHAAGALLAADSNHFAVGAWAETALRLAQRMDSQLRTVIWNGGSGQERRLIERLHGAVTSHNPDAAEQPLLTEDNITECVRFADEADKANLSTADLTADVRMYEAARTLHSVQDLIEHRLRARALQRDPGLNPGFLEAALTQARAYALDFDPHMPEDWTQALAYVESKKKSGFLTPYGLIRLWRDGQVSQFYAVLAHYCGLDYIALRHLMTTASKQGLAIACRAAGFERGIFVQIAQLCEGHSDLSIVDGLYDRVPPDVAQRVIRFHRLNEAA